MATNDIYNLVTKVGYGNSFDVIIRFMHRTDYYPASFKVMDKYKEDSLGQIEIDRLLECAKIKGSLTGLVRVAKGALVPPNPGALEPVRESLESRSVMV
ncbi:hypothetical protein CRG98_008208 [Punica granatum]|uniref:Uncharacterized protein n=1 Tax=Punica granatum TaxID=22663 RepID=A0A2I0KSE2_PUNGR|nr:hypothetical protein CRG98_008208 [Punica granatum]